MCPKKVVHPEKGEAQPREVRRAKEEKVQRKWHKRERKAKRMGQLWKRGEQEWIKQRRGKWYAVSVVTCGYCSESRIKERDNFVQLNCIHDMWCTEYELYKERLDREVMQGRKLKNECDKCRRNPEV